MSANSMEGGNSLPHHIVGAIELRGVATELGVWAVDGGETTVLQRKPEAIETSVDSLDIFGHDLDLVTEAELFGIHDVDTGEELASGPDIVEGYRGYL